MARGRPPKPRPCPPQPPQPEPPLTRAHFDQRIDGVVQTLKLMCRKFELVFELLETIRGMGVIQMATQQEILDEIAGQSTVGDSILVLVQRLVSESDPAARQAILDGLKANRAKFEAAILAGTPQDPNA
jgi:hypothetical protein